MASITWTRGFFRIYLVCSIIFLVGSAFYSFDKIPLRHVVTCSDDLVLDKKVCIEELKNKEKKYDECKKEKSDDTLGLFKCHVYQPFNKISLE